MTLLVWSMYFDCKLNDLHCVFDFGVNLYVVTCSKVALKALWRTFELNADLMFGCVFFQWVHVTWQAETLADNNRGLMVVCIRLRSLLCSQTSLSPLPTYHFVKLTKQALPFFYHTDPLAQTHLGSEAASASTHRAILLLLKRPQQHLFSWILVGRIEANSTQPWLY